MMKSLVQMYLMHDDNKFPCHLCFRNDIARPTKSFIVRSLTMQTTAIACFFYLAGLVFSLSVIRTDDRISQYEADKSLWENDEVSSL